MNRLLCGLFSILLFLGIARTAAAQPQANQAATPLAQARHGFATKTVDRGVKDEPVATPPAEVLQVVHYDSPVGKLPAYLSVAPDSKKRWPAIVWITGGDCNSIGDVWSPAPKHNDQSARAFRESGIITMYPALRGGNGGPGKRESFFGEVDDVLAAAEFLRKQDFVDPDRIYLGGHSTGGTLALLVAEYGGHFRAVFSFGPVASVAGYDKEFLSFDVSNPMEVKLRSPAYWVKSVASPTFVFEGALPSSNVAHLRAMDKLKHDPKLQFLEVSSVNHFSILHPMTHLIARKIRKDTGPETNISFSAEELANVAPR